MNHIQHSHLKTIHEVIWNNFSKKFPVLLYQYIMGRQVNSPSDLLTETYAKNSNFQHEVLFT